MDQEDDIVLFKKNFGSGNVQQQQPQQQTQPAIQDTIAQFKQNFGSEGLPPPKQQQPQEQPPNPQEIQDTGKGVRR